MSLGSQGGNKLVQSKNYLGNIPRTKVSRPLETRATFSAGQLFVFYCEEVYPAMNKKVKQGSFIRSITPLGPTMDKAFCDVFYFFVPFRLIWDHWEEFIAGYNKEAWAQDVEYVTPQIKFKIHANPSGEENAYLGGFLDHCPGLCDVVELSVCEKKLKEQITAETITAEKGEQLLNKLFSVSALYPRAMAKIWNDWFRDENYQDELELYTGDNDEYADDFCFNLLEPSLFAAKYHNRFTTALPQPLKGPDVLAFGDLPVGIYGIENSTIGADHYFGLPIGSVVESGKFVQGAVLDSYANSGAPIVAKNISNTIRQLRLATQTELLLARDARGGTRYVESLLSHWSTHNGDARLQRSEYLGSRQIPLNVTQITNTAQGDSSALGNVGGQSVTRDVATFFSKGFSEYGVVLGVGVVRTNLSYGSGRRKQFTRKGRFDYIWPEFRHVGDVELKATELDQNWAYISDGEFIDRVLGYTPYGSELREGYNANTGLFRARADGSLSYLTYQEVFDDDSVPQMSSNYIKQPSEVVANTLVDQTGPQFYAIFQIVEESVIPLDPTSDPGLMDHF